jgi:hypothetical protein
MVCGNPPSISHLRKFGCCVYIPISPPQTIAMGYTPMVVRSLDLEKDPFRPRDDEEQILGPGFTYLSVVGALMYLANNTQLDIAFVVNLLARHSFAPTKRQWVGIKNIFRYLNGTKDLGLFYKISNDPSLIGITILGIYMIPTMADRKQDLYFYKVELPSHGNCLKKLW